MTVLIRSTLAFFRSRNQQAIVELALRQQLATYAQTRPKPKLTPLDRAFWVALFRLWPQWKEVLVIGKPDTAGLCLLLQLRARQDATEGFTSGPADGEPAVAGLPSRRIAPCGWPSPPLRLAGGGVVTVFKHATRPTVRVGAF